MRTSLSKKRETKVITSPSPEHSGRAAPQLPASLQRGPQLPADIQLEPFIFPWFVWLLRLRGAPAAICHLLNNLLHVARPLTRNLWLCIHLGPSTVSLRIDSVLWLIPSKRLRHTGPTRPGQVRRIAIRLNGRLDASSRFCTVGVPWGRGKLYDMWWGYHIDGNESGVEQLFQPFRLCSSFPVQQRCPPIAPAQGLGSCLFWTRLIRRPAWRSCINIICLDERTGGSDVLLRNTHVSMEIRSSGHVSSRTAMMTTDGMTLINPEMLRAYVGSQNGILDRKRWFVNNTKWNVMKWWGG